MTKATKSIKLIAVGKGGGSWGSMEHLFGIKK